jgi:hypothetical protein
MIGESTQLDTGVVIAHSGHWLMEEQLAATIAAIRSFLDAKS